MRKVTWSQHFDEIADVLYRRILSLHIFSWTFLNNESRGRKNINSCKIIFKDKHNSMASQPFFLK
jgi:hypothetical protein